MMLCESEVNAAAAFATHVCVSTVYWSDDLSDDEAFALKFSI